MKMATETRLYNIIISFYINNLYILCNCSN